MTAHALATAPPLARPRPPLETPLAAPHSALANAIRALAMDAVERAKSGHPGMPMGMADAAAVLFQRHLKFDARDPAWPDRDRFVLSAGHGSMLLYALLYLVGTPGVELDDLQSFRRLGAKTAGHPEYGHCPGVETTTGPLGQGLATAVGMALAERLLNARYGDELVDHRTYVVAGDGCLMEGISHEAIDLAGHLRLARLIVLFDDNGISIDGATSLSTSIDQSRRFEAAGWHVQRVDGHDPEAVDVALEEAKADQRPSLIACRTVIGRGAPTKQGTAATHGSPLGAAEIAGARQALDWPHPPFEVPEPILSAWRAIGERGRREHGLWQARLAGTPEPLREGFEADHSGDLAPGLDAALQEVSAGFAASAPALATRQSSQKVLERLVAAQPNLIGGSADLTGSNGTRPGGLKPVTADDFAGRYIHYGIREHGMAAAMNGLALHGGFVPYGGTFLAFADYSRPAIRLGALMGVRAIHVMTHDSIGLGEDGPTHQPVEHLASLRAIPNLLVFRPADAVETAEAWACALGARGTPSVLCLTRQELPTLRSDAAENQVARGAYVLREVRQRDVTLLATGSEVSLAVEAAERLAEEGVFAAVVSMPCWELFQAQPESYRRAVLGTAPRLGVEAAIELGWSRWLGPNGVFVGMTGFGASGPAEDLYRHFGITADRIVGAARDLLN